MTLLNGFGMVVADSLFRTDLFSLQKKRTHSAKKSEW